MSADSPTPPPTLREKLAWVESAERIGALGPGSFLKTVVEFLKILKKPDSDVDTIIAANDTGYGAAVDAAMPLLQEFLNDTGDAVKQAEYVKALDDMPHLRTKCYKLTEPNKDGEVASAGSSSTNFEAFMFLNKGIPGIQDALSDKEFKDKLVLQGKLNTLTEGCKTIVFNDPRKLYGEQLVGPTANMTNILACGFTLLYSELRRINRDINIDADKDIHYIMHLMLVCYMVQAQQPQPPPADIPPEEITRLKDIFLGNRGVRGLLDLQTAADKYYTREWFADLETKVEKQAIFTGMKENKQLNMQERKDGVPDVYGHLFEPTNLPSFYIDINNYSVIKFKEFRDYLFKTFYPTTAAPTTAAAKKGGTRTYSRKKGRKQKGNTARQIIRWH